MLRCRKLAWLICLACLGCGGPSSSYDATVEGTVTVDGQLAKRGRVVFHPLDEGPVAYGNIFPNGSYSIRVGQGDLSDVDGGEVPSGDYIVTVVVNMPSSEGEAVSDGGPPKPAARVTAAKYADKATSDLRAAVKPGRNVVPLELTSAVAAEAESQDSDTGASIETDTVETEINGSGDVTDQAEQDEPSDTPASPAGAPAEEPTP